MTSKYSTQNQLLLSKLLEFYAGTEYLDKMLDIINGQSKIQMFIKGIFIFLEEQFLQLEIEKRIF